MPSPHTCPRSVRLKLEPKHRATWGISADPLYQPALPFPPSYVPLNRWMIHSIVFPGSSHVLMSIRPGQRQGLGPDRLVMAIYGDYGICYFPVYGLRFPGVQGCDNLLIGLRGLPLLADL